MSKQETLEQQVEEILLTFCLPPNVPRKYVVKAMTEDPDFIKAKASVLNLITKAQLSLIKSAECLLETEEPMIDEIWFTYNGLPMRKDTLISALESELKE